MRHSLIVALAGAMALAGCTASQTDAIGNTAKADVAKAEAAVDNAFAKAGVFVVAKIKPAVDRADNWLGAKLGPSLDKASDAFFHNKWALQAYRGEADGHHDGEAR